MPFDLTRRLAAEALGTLFLVMAVVGSGIMAAKLAGGNGAIALLCNTLATGAVLFVIITIFAPVSGAHFNPAVATFGLLGTILGCVRFKPDAMATAVGLYITSAYWFTASTSFANPAVTIARSLSDTFAGIAPRDVAPFIVAELLGALAAAGLFAWLFTQPAAAVKKTK